MKKILPLFSYLFHPIFVPFFGALIYFFFSENYLATIQKYLLLIQIVIVTLLIPISFFYYLKTIGKIDSVMISKVGQRKFPLLIQILLLLIITQKSITVDRIPELYYFLLGGLISLAIAFVFLFFKIKASLHLLGTSTLMIFTIELSLHNQANMLFIIVPLIVINGLVASSRLEMKAHSIKEVLIGFIIGILPQIALFYFWL